MSRARLGALLVMATAGCLAAPAVVSAVPQASQRRAVLIVERRGATLEDLVSGVGSSAASASGGTALLVGGYERPPGASELDVGGMRVFVLVPDGGDPREAVGAATALLLVVGIPGPGRVASSHDDTQALFLASGAAEDLLGAVRRGADAATEPSSLTSDSTRREGVVAAADVDATVAAFLGEPEADLGEPIRAIDALPPGDLHARYLEQRSLYVPIGTAAASFVAGAGLLASALVALPRRRGDERLRRIVGWAALSVPALATSLLAAGHLPELTYANALPFIALVTVFGTLVFSPLERGVLTSVPAGIGVAVLAFFVVEAILGWTAMLTPLLGGSQLDGGRFYGLPNVAIGLLVGSSVWAAQRVSTIVGFALICAVALFAGLPLVGTNLGGGVTLFATAGLWVAVRERRRLGLARAVAVAFGVTALGTAVILVAHALSPVATHVTRFERSVDRPSDVLATIVDRLGVGFDLIARNPAAAVPVVGLAVALLVALRPPPAIRVTFERWPEWRDAVVVILSAGVVAYLANDSGPAAAGLAFGLGVGGMLGVSLLALPGKMDADG